MVALWPVRHEILLLSCEDRVPDGTKNGQSPWGGYRVSKYLGVSSQKSERGYDQVIVQDSGGRRGPGREDQADSTSQALDWVKQRTYTHGVLEFYTQEALRQKLRLHSDYRFVQWEEGEEIIAVHKATGHKIRWDRGWVAVDSTTMQQETCPYCGASCIGTYGEQKRCHQCGKQWPAPRVTYMG